MAPHCWAGRACPAATAPGCYWPSERPSAALELAAVRLGFRDLLVLAGVGSDLLQLLNHDLKFFAVLFGLEGSGVQAGRFQVLADVTESDVLGTIAGRLEVVQER